MYAKEKKEKNKRKHVTLRGDKEGQKTKIKIK